MKSIANNQTRLTNLHDIQGRVIKRTYEKKEPVTGWVIDKEIRNVWTGWSLIEQHENNSLTTEHVEGIGLDDHLLEHNVATAQSTWFHADMLGSTICLTNNAGQPVEYYRYTAFGQPQPLAPNLTPRSPALAKTAHLYTGREHLPAFNLTDHRNRLYSPHLGRWISTDPIQFEAGDVNLYRYVGNNTMNGTDPMGLFTREEAEKLLKEYNIVDYKTKTSTEVYSFVGGWLQEMHDSGDSEYANSCAVRLSIALSRFGVNLKGQFGANFIGEDGHSNNLGGKKHVIISAGDMVTYLKKLLERMIMKQKRNIAKIVMWMIF